MANNPKEFAELIFEIRTGGFKEDVINLRFMGIDTLDAKALMNALQENQEIAGKIRMIELSQNNIDSIAIPGTLIVLERLELDDNQLSSIAIPDTLTALYSLELGPNQLSSIAIPDTLTALEILGLNDNKLSSIAIPDTLIALQCLDLSNNQLSSIAIPDTLTALQELYLSNNQLSSIAIPGTLIALRELHLGNNQLSVASKHGLASLNRRLPDLELEVDGDLTQLPPLNAEHLQQIFFGNPNDQADLAHRAQQIFSKTRVSLNVIARTLAAMPSALPELVSCKILSFLYAPKTKNYMPSINLYKNMFESDRPEHKLIDEYAELTQKKIIPALYSNWEGLTREVVNNASSNQQTMLTLRLNKLIATNKLSAQNFQPKNGAKDLLTIFKIFEKNNLLAQPVNNQDLAAASQEPSAKRAKYNN